MAVPAVRTLSQYGERRIPNYDVSHHRDANRSQPHQRYEKDILSDLEEEKTNNPTLWPPGSPDLNALDLFYWGCLKDKVYTTTITSIQNLCQRVEAAAGEISEWRYLLLLIRAFVRRCRAYIRDEVFNASINGINL
ncbi:hypothetical protein ABEB36_014849 [Hypothenemus hampei]|uniref:Uncharacterized protein n=1 Tax=Hypothenemus hampei TaxID=57062 RepID=A0ABD1E1B5_HYPHA